MAEQTFSVHPEGLRGYAELLKRNNGHLGEMHVYVDGPGTSTEGLMGILAHFNTVAQDVARWQSRVLADMNGKLADTTEGLKAAADLYAHTDAERAGEFDKTVPKAPVDGATPERGPG